MAKTKKAKATVPDAVQEAREPQEAAQDVREPEAVSGAPVSAPTGPEAGEIIGPKDPAELEGCQDEAELSEGLPTEYVVTVEGGLRLRKRPSPDAPVVAVLPWGAGVFADEPPIGEWVCVTTGLLSGYMLVKHLAPLTAELKRAIVYE